MRCRHKMSASPAGEALCHLLRSGGRGVLSAAAVDGNVNRRHQQRGGREADAGLHACGEEFHFVAVCPLGGVYRHEHTDDLLDLGLFAVDEAGPALVIGDGKHELLPRLGGKLAAQVAVLHLLNGAGAALDNGRQLMQGVVVGVSGAETTTDFLKADAVYIICRCLNVTRYGVALVIITEVFQDRFIGTLYLCHVGTIISVDRSVLFCGEGVFDIRGILGRLGLVSGFLFAGLACRHGVFFRGFGLGVVFLGQCSCVFGGDFEAVEKICRTE